MTQREREVLEIIRENPMATHEQIAARLGISASTVSVHVTSLLQQGVLAGRGYVINEPYVVCLGVAIMDVFGFAGQALVAEDKNPGSEVRISCGGAGRNIAENMARLDVAVKYISVVGEDAFGRELVEACRAAGMDVSGMQMLPGERTATYLCILDRAGSQLAALTDSAIEHRQTVDFFRAQDRILGGARAIVMTGEPAEGVVRYLHGRYPKTPIYADTASGPDALAFLEKLPCYELIKMNRHEAALLSGSDDPEEAARILLAKGAGRVVVTMGDRGSLYADRGGRVCFGPAIPPQRMVNPSGAGDAFAAALFGCDLAGFDIRRSLRFAAAAAAIARESGQSVNPALSRDAVERRLETAGLL